MVAQRWKTIRGEIVIVLAQINFKTKLKHVLLSNFPLIWLWNWFAFSRVFSSEAIMADEASSSSDLKDDTLDVNISLSVFFFFFRLVACES